MTPVAYSWPLIPNAITAQLAAGVEKASACDEQKEAGVDRREATRSTDDATSEHIRDERVQSGASTLRGPGAAACRHAPCPYRIHRTDVRARHHVEATWASEKEPPARGDIEGTQATQSAQGRPFSRPQWPRRTDPKRAWRRRSRHAPCPYKIHRDRCIRYHVEAMWAGEGEPPTRGGTGGVHAIWSTQGRPISPAVSEYALPVGACICPCPAAMEAAQGSKSPWPRLAVTVVSVECCRPLCTSRV